MEFQEKPRYYPDHPTLSTAFLERVKRMDPDSWSRLVATFGPIVYRWCRASGVVDVDASDVVQNVFASVVRGVGSFQPQKEHGSFRSWLATITRNRVREYFRGKAKQCEATGGTDAMTRLQQQPEVWDSTISPENAQPLINRRVLQSVRDEFEATTWNAFWMTTVDGKTAADVSAEVGISLASVYQAKSRVLRRLRQRLAEIPD